MRKKGVTKKYQKFLVASISTAVVASTAIPAAVPTLAAEKSFSDLHEGSFGYHEIMALTQAGIIDGYPDGTYRADQALTRQQAAKLFAKALNLETPSDIDGFDDVNPNSQYYDAILAVKKAGIFKGSGNKFRPTEHLTREQMATVLVRAFQLKEKKSVKVPFSDLNLISPSHKKDVEILYQNGVTTGKANNTFAPREAVTRGQFAVFLYRLLYNTLPQHIEKITNDKVVISGVEYSLSQDVKGILNSKNEKGLKGAKIKFEKVNQKITAITYLEITSSGEPAKQGKKEFSGNLVLDGGNNTIKGNVKVNANYISINNLKVAGNLEISEKLLNDFHSINLHIEGKTIINGGDDNTVVFENATLNKVETNKEGVKVELKGTTTLEEMTVTRSANITSDSTVVIPKLTITKGVQEVEINSKVSSLAIESEKPITLKGNGTIGNLVLPEGTKASDIIKNFDDVKDAITQINGSDQKNTGSTPSAGGNNHTSSPNHSNPPSEDEGTPENNLNVPPQSIQNLTAIADNQQVTLNWSANVDDDFARYEIYYKQGTSVDKNSSEAQKVEIATQSTTSTTISNLTNDTEYAFVIYVVDIAGNYSGASPVITASPSNTVTVSENPFEENTTYTHNYNINISEDATYGASTIGNNAIVQGNVTLKGPISRSVTLQNVDIKGTLYLDPGDNGSVTLSNVTADRIEVLSGEKGTIHLDNVESKDVLILDDNGVRVKTDGNSLINNLQIAPINPSAQTEVQLEGDFNDAKVKVTKGATITAKQGFLANSIEVALESNENEVVLAADDENIQLPIVEVKSAAKIKTAENSKVNIPQIKISTDNQNESISLEGDFGEPEVTVETPVALNVNTEIKKLEAKTSVKLDKNSVVEKIKTIEVLSESATIDADKELKDKLSQIRENSISLAIDKIEKLPEVNNVNQEHIWLIEEAQNAVNMAKALGASDSDFVVEGQDLIAKLTELKQAVKIKIDAINQLKKKLLVLPYDARSVTAFGLNRLKKDVAAAKEAKAEVEKFISESDLSTLPFSDLLSRLSSAESRISELEEDVSAARTDAENALHALESYSDITKENIDEATAALKTAKEKVAIAKSKGVTLTESKTIITNFEAKIQTYLEKAIDNVNKLIESLPSVEAITFENYKEIQEKLQQVQEEINAAMQKGATATEFANLAKITEIQNKINKLVEERDLALEAANTAIDQLPSVEDIRIATLEENKQTLEGAKRAVEKALDNGVSREEISQIENIDKVERKIAELEEYIQAVTNLFADNDKTTLASNVQQNDIDTVLEKVQSVTNEEDRNILLADIAVAQRLLDTKIVESVMEQITITNEVISDLSLVTSKNGVTISWASSNENLISRDGVVTRPNHGEGDKVVTLTATFAKNNVSRTKSFNVTVKKLPDTDAPTVTLMNHATEIKVGELVTVQSSEAGSVYLVPGHVSITSSADLENLVNTEGVKKLAVESPNADIHFETSPLTSGQYKIYAVDESGNVSDPVIFTLEDASQEEMGNGNIFKNYYKNTIVTEVVTLGITGRGFSLNTFINSDYDEDELTFKVHSDNEQVVTASIDARTKFLEFHLEGSTGTAVITLTATNQEGESESITLKFKVIDFDFVGEEKSLVYFDLWNYSQYAYVEELGNEVTAMSELPGKVYLAPATDDYLDEAGLEELVQSGEALVDENAQGNQVRTFDTSKLQKGVYELYLVNDEYGLVQGTHRYIYLMDASEAAAVQAIIQSANSTELRNNLAKIKDELGIDWNAFTQLDEQKQELVLIDLLDNFKDDSKRTLGVIKEAFKWSVKFYGGESQPPNDESDGSIFRDKQITQTVILSTGFNGKSYGLEQFINSNYDVDELTFELHSDNEQVATASIEKSNGTKFLNLDFKGNTGTAVITLTATNQEGQSESITLEFKVIDFNFIGEEKSLVYLDFRNYSTDGYVEKLGNEVTVMSGLAGKVYLAPATDDYLDEAGLEELVQSGEALVDENAQGNQVRTFDTSKLQKGVYELYLVNDEYGLVQGTHRYIYLMDASEAAAVQAIVQSTDTNELKTNLEQFKDELGIDWTAFEQLDELIQESVLKNVLLNFQNNVEKYKTLRAIKEEFEWFMNHHGGESQPPNDESNGSIFIDEYKNTTVTEIENVENIGRGISLNTYINPYYDMDNLTFEVTSNNEQVVTASIEESNGTKFLNLDFKGNTGTAIITLTATNQEGQSESITLEFKVIEFDFVEEEKSLIYRDYWGSIDGYVEELGNEVTVMSGLSGKVYLAPVMSEYNKDDLEELVVLGKALVQEDDRDNQIRTFDTSKLQKGLYKLYLVNDEYGLVILNDRYIYLMDAREAEAVQSIVQSTNASELKTNLEQFKDELGIDWTAFEQLDEQKQYIVLMDLLGKIEYEKYKTPGVIKEAFESAVNRFKGESQPPSGGGGSSEKTLNFLPDADDLTKLDYIANFELNLSNLKFSVASVPENNGFGGELVLNGVTPGENELLFDWDSTNVTHDGEGVLTIIDNNGTENIYSDDLELEVHFEVSNGVVTFKDVE